MNKVIPLTTEALVSSHKDHWVIPALQDWMRQRKVRYDVGTDSFFIGKDNVSLEDVVLEALNSFEKPGNKMTKNIATGGLKSIARQSRAEVVAEIRDRIVPCAVDDTALRAWLQELLVKMDSEEFENCVTVVKQWMWLVKRTLKELPQQWHIMPIFWGGQGGGKSTQIESLLKPLKPFWARDSFRVFMGQFDALPMHRNYAIFLDEMESASRAESARVKACMDAAVIPGRGMYSDKGRNLARNSSFIAATNELPPHGLLDSTGARRFYSLECKSTPVVGARAKFFNSVDYEALWHCVDVDADAPLIARREQISIVQHATNRAPGTIERFVVEGCEPSEGAELRLTDFAESMREFCHQNGLDFRFPFQKLAVLQLGQLGLNLVNRGNRFIIRGLAVRKS